MPEKPLILAVDDEQDFLEIVSLYLESSGFRAATLLTTDEDEFLRHCETLQPALVIIDIYAAAEPVGLSLAAALKKNPRTAHIKVILWSVVSPPQDSLADDFFNKGEDMKLLVEKIKRHLLTTAKHLL